LGTIEGSVIAKGECSKGCTNVKKSNISKDYKSSGQTSDYGLEEWLVCFLTPMPCYSILSCP
jgi:hypothetical protein